MQKKIAILHRYTADQIKQTNAAFPFLAAKGADVLTFKEFNRLDGFWKFWKSIAWIFYAPMLVIGKGYDVIYCDDSYPFYPTLVKLVSPRSKVILRIGDLHLLYYYKGFAYKFLHFFEKISWLVADEILPISEAMADFIRAEIKDSTPIKTILDPVDPTDFQPMKCCQPNGVMFHGVLTRNKNVDILLEAARLLPDIDFKIVGDGPDLNRLQKIAPSNVFFFGWAPFKDIPHHISGCKVGVALRSDNPGNDYVVTSPYLQYGVMGKPCLVTRRKVFGDYPWQFSTADEMVRLIRVLLNHPEAGTILQRHILRHHDAKKISEQIWETLTRA